MTIIYIIIAVSAMGAGLIWALVAKAKKEERERLLREQEELNNKLERDRVTDDEQIRNTTDDDLTNRLNKWVRPPGGE